MPQQGYTYDQLVKMGAKPGGYTYDELIAQGAQPTVSEVAAMKPPTMMDKLLSYGAGAANTAKDVGIGIAKEAASTTAGLVDLVEAAKRKTGLFEPRTPEVVVPGLVFGAPPASLGTTAEVRAKAQSSNMAQSIGKGAAQIGEFMLPAGGEAAIAAKLKTGSAAVNALVKAGLSGLSSAAVGSMQEGSTNNALTYGLGGSAASLGMQGVMKGLGALGLKAEDALVKASTRDYTDGFRVENIQKYDLGGSLGKTFEKTQTAIDERVGRLKLILANNPAASVDIGKIYSDTLQQYVGNKQADDALLRVLQRIEFGLNERGVQFPANMSLDLVNANLAKQEVGQLGAWLHDPSGKVMSDADVVLEKVANRFYSNLKTAIQNSSGDPAISKLNAELGELIPIRNAVMRRIPVASRRDILSLGDIVSMSQRQWGLTALKRTLGSGTAADLMMRSSQGTGQTAAKALTGIGAQMLRTH